MKPTNADLNDVAKELDKCLQSAYDKGYQKGFDDCINRKDGVRPHYIDGYRDGEYLGYSIGLRYMANTVSRLEQLGNEDTDELFPEIKDTDGTFLDLFKNYKLEEIVDKVNVFWENQEKNEVRELIDKIGLEKMREFLVEFEKLPKNEFGYRENKGYKC